MSTTHVTLGAAADERKARLAKLKSLKRKQPSDEHELHPPSNPHSPAPPTSAEPDVSRLHLSGRNYDPETKGPKLGFEENPAALVEKTLEKQAEEIEEVIRKKAEEEEKDEKGVDLFKLQPKKPNWDLKRDLGVKLEVLNVRTDNAIARLVRERIEGVKRGAKGKKAGNVDEGEDMGMEGSTLVEGLKVREREEEEDKRREKEMDDEGM